MVMQGTRRGPERRKTRQASRPTDARSHYWMPQNSLSGSFFFLFANCLILPTGTTCLQLSIFDFFSSTTYRPQNRPPPPGLYLWDKLRTENSRQPSCIIHTHTHTHYTHPPHWGGTGLTIVPTLNMRNPSNPIVAVHTPSARLSDLLEVPFGR